MNILFLTREYKHEKLYHCGGTGVFYSQLAPKLANLGHNVYVFGVNRNNINFKDHGVNIRFTKSIFKRNKFINLLRSITGKIKYFENLHFKLHEYEKKDIAKQLYLFLHVNNLKIDIIETHDFEGLSLYLNNSIPYVVRCHGSYTVLANYFGYKPEKGRMHCEKKAMQKVKNSIFISKFNKYVNTELFGKLNHKLIYNGIDTVLFNYENESIIPNSIFFFGNLTIEKGAEVAIESFVEINKQKPETTLHFVGRETNFKNKLLETINKNNLDNKVFFHGAQDTKSLIALLSKAQLIFFPSKGENFSLGILEAMSLKKTIICSNIPAFNEVIVNDFNGLISNSTNEFFTQSIILLNNFEKSKILAENARNTVKKDFSLETMVNKTLSYYSEILQENE